MFCVRENIGCIVEYCNLVFVVFLAWSLTKRGSRKVRSMGSIRGALDRPFDVMTKGLVFFKDWELWTVKDSKMIMSRHPRVAFSDNEDYLRLAVQRNL